MSTEHSSFRGSRRDVWEMLRKAVSAANGDGRGILYGLKLRLGVAMLTEVQQDFIVKSRGGRGQDGIQWEPLKPATIAARRVTGAERKAAGLTKANANRGLLTPEENKQWKQLFNYKLGRLRLDLPDKEAKGIAAAFAWTEMKARGAKTKLAVFGNRKVDILRDTGELPRSFSPGVDDRPSHADGQVFRIEGSLVSVGTNKKTRHHKGIPNRLPSRPFWPIDGSIPGPWWGTIRTAAVRGVKQALLMLARAA